ncbi:putative reverse transcriptase domain-containing protein [Tanacetum coccineum]|uniref:Reverse transcriptase domain-containing protein n=1 Tax=Tanacetum coccineum TaxID=301880 RepID=A0ABQ5CDW0_9ASTR
MPCQLLLKELNPRSFTLPCTIGSLNFHAMADLGASVNVIPKSMFEHLKLANLKKTDMLVEMANMTKIAPMGIVENVLVKIDKFLFPSDFVVIDMLNTRNETMILGRPFLATIHAEIDDFNKEISLGIRDDRVTFGELGPMKDPRARSFDDSKWVFDLEIDQLTDEYELGIGKKGHILKDIWEYCEKVQGDNINWWHNHGFEEDERQESGLDIEEYDPPNVHVETFEVKRYSFDSRHNFICVTKEIEDTLPLGRENGSRGYEFSQYMLVESSSLAIIIRSTEQCSEESLILILLLFLTFHFLNVQ